MSELDDEQDASGSEQSRRAFLKNTGLATAGVLVGCNATDIMMVDPMVDDPLSPADASLDSSDAGPEMLADSGSPEPTDAGVPTDVGVPPDAALSPGRLPESMPESANFPLGIASGDVTSEAAVLWTRYVGIAPLHLVVWEMEADEYGPRVYDEQVTPSEDGFVHVDVAGLSSRARYRYVFAEVDEDGGIRRSTVGRFRAAPADDWSGPLLVGALSCTRNGRDFDTVERAGERDDYDVFLLLGDTSYNDGARTANDYRDKWHENLSTAGYRSLRAATSVLATWDDHEIDNNFNPETIDPDLFATAREAYFEHLPLRRSSEDPDRIWKRLRWGQTADVFVLDTRGERLPSTRRTRDAQYISRAQMDWLKRELLTSSARFKILMNSVPITNLPVLWDVQASDRWEGYASQRTEILSHIEDNAIAGVLWVAADFHFGSIQWVDRSGPGSTQREVLVGPGAQIPNYLATSLTAPQFEWKTLTNNYTTLTLDPTAGEVTMRYYDGDGDIIEERAFEV